MAEVPPAIEPWRAKLAEGDPDGAWRLFMAGYSSVVVSAVRRLVGSEDRSDALRHVFQELSAHGLARLTRYRDDVPRPAGFSTWLVTVVHHLVVDWLRHRDGRCRIATPESLSPIQRRIFVEVFVRRRPHVEAFEVVRPTVSGDLSFSHFLRELAETYRIVEHTRPRGVMHYMRSSSPPEDVCTGPAVRDHAAEALLAAAMRRLDDQDRMALQLYVVESMPAAEVARILSWPNSKTVYNRVYRALAALRRALEETGIGPDDLG